MLSSRKSPIIIGLISLTLIGLVNGFIAYNCNITTTTLKTISLLDIAKCGTSFDRVQSDDSYIQILKVDNIHETKVIQCKINIRRQIYSCGVGSHGSLLSNEEFIQEVDYSTCKQMHSSKGYVHYAFLEPIIQKIKINSTVHEAFNFFGTNDSWRNCDGTTYSDVFGERHNVTVHLEIETSIHEQTAKINAKNNKIYFESGTSCPLSAESCLDSQNGNSFWEAIPNDNCKSNQYSILYEGNAQKLTGNSSSDNPVIYTFNKEQATFGFQIIAKKNLCGNVIYRTEHPQLFIFEIKKDAKFISESPLSKSLDIFAHANSRFVYAEVTLPLDQHQLYERILLKKCNSDNRVMENAFVQIGYAPDLFAYNLMKGPGYMSAIRGEVAYITRCLPVDVKVERSEFCSSELRVNHRNQTFFMTPKSHILKKNYNPLLCGSILPVQYYIHGSWYKVPYEEPSPSTLEEETESNAFLYDLLFLCFKIVWKILSSIISIITNIYFLLFALAVWKFFSNLNYDVILHTI